MWNTNELCVFFKNGNYLIEFFLLKMGKYLKFWDSFVNVVRAVLNNGFPHIFQMVMER